MRKIVLLLLLLPACSVEERGAPGTNPHTEVQMPGQTGDTVDVILSAPHAAAVGDDVPISIVVQNNRDRSVSLSLTGRELVYDIVVANADSTVVWQRLQDQTVQQILQLRTLPPHGSFTLYDRWIPMEPGNYIIGAQLPTDTEPLNAQPITITVR